MKCHSRELPEPDGTGERLARDRQRHRLHAASCQHQCESASREGVVAGVAVDALVTGEEKRVPPRPLYWVCTVEAMPVAQVCLLYTVQTYEELRDDIFKWFYVPYPKSHEGVQQAERQLYRSIREGREILPVAQILLPAVSAARTARVVEL